MIYDTCVIGGGIVGLATALEQLRRRPDAGVLLLEKEDRPARHQTGHNSGVIHAGVYYRPGSLKAALCRAGAAATRDFCAEHGVPFETRGKLIVAASPRELARMEDVRQNAIGNGLVVEVLDAAELGRREPNVTGLGALFIAETGIVDYAEIAAAMAREIGEAGGEIVYRAEVTAIREAGDRVTIRAGERSWSARRLIACAGLQSDRVALMAGLSIDHRIVPFRGEFFELRPERADLVRHLIYPVPDPALPFLGIHLTPTIDGRLKVGPNAVLGLAREGYSRFAVSPRDMLAYAAFPGFWRVIAANWRSALSEAGNSLFKRRYLEACRRYCPSLEAADLTRRSVGIRAQAVRGNGELVQDFLFIETPRSLHVCNAPSPAATSAIPIARMIVDRALAGAG